MVQTIDWQNNVEPAIAGNKRLTTSFIEQRAVILGHTDALTGMNIKFVESGERMDYLRQRASGVRRDVSSLRNDLLLLAFSLGGVGKLFFDTADAAAKFQSSAASISSVAISTGNSLDATKKAAIALTNDGLLSISGASLGLKNLLSGGLNLEQATKVMYLFKDAAAFNRQGMLGFEEAIVRATAGVKMHQAKLLDDVGIIGRFAQMMEAQGFKLEDLADKSKKLAAAEALTNALMQQGSYFLGDAQIAAGIYTGQQAKLETQMLRTKAAFGGILISSSGIFSEAIKEILTFLSHLQDLIEANKTLISSRVGEYFDQFQKILKNVWMILEPIVKFIAKILDLVSQLGIAPWLAMFYILEKIGHKFIDIEMAIKHLAGPQLTTQGIFDTIALSKYGDNVDKVMEKITNVKKTLTEISSGVTLPSNWGEQVARAQMLSQKGYKTYSSEQIAKMPTNLQGFWKDVAKSDDILMATENLEKLKSKINGITAINFTQSTKEIQNLATSLELAGAKGVSFFTPAVAGLSNVGKELVALETKSATFGNAFMMVMKSAGTSIMTFGRTVMATMASMLPILAIQAVIVGVTLLIDALSEGSRKSAELQEKLKEQTRLAEEEQARLYGNKISAINNIQGQLDQYNELSKKVNKTAEDYRELATKKTEIISLMSKEGIALNNGITANGLYADSIAGVSKKLQEEIEKHSELQKTIIQMQQAQTAQKIGETFTEKNFFTGYSKANDLRQLLENTGQGGGLNLMNALFKTENIPNQRLGITETIVTGIKADEKEIGQTLRNYYNEVVTQLENTNSALIKATAEQKAKGNVNPATGFIIPTPNIAKWQRGVDALRLTLVGLQDMGITADDTQKKLDALAPAITKVTTAASGVKTAGSDAFLNWLQRVQEAAEKAKTTGGIADKLITAIYDVIDAKRVLAEFDRKEQDKTGSLLGYNPENIDKAKQAITGMGLLIGKIVGEYQINADIANAQWDEQIKKIGMSSDQMKIYQVEIERLQKIKPFQAILDSLNSVPESLRGNISGFDTLRQTYIEIIAKINEYTDAMKLLLTVQATLNKSLKQNETQNKTLTEVGFSGAMFGSANKLGLGNISSDLGGAFKSAADIQSYKTALETLKQGGITTGDTVDEYTRKIEDKNAELAKSFASLAGSIAESVTSLLQNLDIFGNKYAEEMATLTATHQTQLATIGINQQVNQDLLDDSYKRGLINYQEYEIQKTLGLKKTAAEEKRTNALALIEQQKANELQAIDQKIAVATFLQTKALEFSTLAAAYAAGGAILSVIPGFNAEGAAMLSASVGYAAMAALLGIASAAYGGPAGLMQQKAGIIGKYDIQKAGVEGQYNKEVGLAENQAAQQRNLVSGAGNASATGGTISGSVTAQEMHITIAPIVTIRGETVILSNIGVAEAASILGDFTVTRIQEALNNKEITIGNN